MANLTESSDFDTILPYQLRALRLREFEAFAAARAAERATAARAAAGPVPVLGSAPATRVSGCEPDSIRAGIRHMATGRMTVTHVTLKTVMAMLKTRALSGRGLLEDPRLEAIVMDGERKVFAGFWS